jgi:hypothetical protein
MIYLLFLIFLFKIIFLYIFYCSKNNFLCKTKFHVIRYREKKKINQIPFNLMEIYGITRNIIDI